MLMTPYVEIDSEILKRNIKTKAKKLAGYNIAHRPHIKTHKNTEIARMQIKAGAIGITVSHLGEAQVFYDAGFDNILIAYNLIGKEKLDRFAKMHINRHMLTTVDSIEIASGLNDVGMKSGKPVQVLVEIDLGENRCGIPPDTVKDFVRQLKEYKYLYVTGIMSYCGSIYSCSCESERTRIVTMERDALLGAQEILKSAGYSADITSAGSTVASCYPHLLSGVSEIRCGNYVFNDRKNIENGTVQIDDCAMRIIATVISVPTPGRVTLDIGSKVLSSDRAAGEGFGFIDSKPKSIIAKVNEEHAMVDANGEAFTIGERVSIIPNHSCVVANLVDHMYEMSDGIFVRKLSAGMRGLYG